MSDIIYGIRGLLSAAWHFLMNTYIPGTEIAFGVFFVGLAMIPIGFRFLSIAIGYNVGEAGGLGALSPSADYGAAGSKSLRVPDARKNDVR